MIKALILGEEERGQSQYQVVCFLFHFPKDSFISSDAMSKLRQKNPSAIRIPEQDLVRDNYTMDYHVMLQHSGVFSPHVADMCAEAKESTYVRHEDLTVWSINQGECWLFMQILTSDMNRNRVFRVVYHEIHRVYVYHPSSIWY